MKKEIKGFIFGVITTSIFSAIGVYAATQLTTIDVYKDNVTIYANNNVVDAPNFTYNDTTYVPLRSVLELMDCSLFYDAETKSVLAYNDFVLNYLCDGTYFEDGEYIYDTITRRPHNNYDDYANYQIFVDHTVVEDNISNVKSHIIPNDKYGQILEWYWTDTADDVTNNYSEQTTSPNNLDFPLHLYSNDGKTYLGKLTLNEYDADSIWNKYGKYGSEYGSDSIWNQYGTYGSKYNSKSAFSEYTNTPPVIVTNSGKFVGYLSANKYLPNAFTIYEIHTFLSQYER